MTIPVMKTNIDPELAASAGSAKTIYENIPSWPCPPNRTWAAFWDGCFTATVTFMGDGKYQVFVVDHRDTFRPRVHHDQFWETYVAAMEDLQDVLSFRYQKSSSSRIRLRHAHPS